MNRTTFSALALAVALAAAPAHAATVVTSVAADGSNHLAVSGSTANMTFDQDAGTAAEATSKGLTASFAGDYASRTTVAPFGTTAYGVFALTPNPYDGNGYFAIGGIDGNGIQSSLTLTGTSPFSSISVFVGSLDAFNTVQLLGAAGDVIATYTGTQMAGGATIPSPGNTSAADNRRVTFTGTDGTTYAGIRFYNTGNNSAFEFDNVSFTAAVPEPATWAMMLVGFGMVAGAARYRRRGTRAVFA